MHLNFAILECTNFMHFNLVFSQRSTSIYLPEAFDGKYEFFDACEKFCSITVNSESVYTSLTSLLNKVTESKQDIQLRP